MDEVLTDEAGYTVHITFVPHLVPMSRGMLTTIYAQSTEPVDVIRKILESFYANAPFVQVLPEGQIPETRHVRGTNTCRIGVAADAGSGRVIIVSAIDNLGKGAAGQALQCMNHMAGCEETAGLTAVPLSV
jgi:N-acetyl-gamma-glutamyl-phosphate reductase